MSRIVRNRIKRSRHTSAVGVRTIVVMPTTTTLLSLADLLLSSIGIAPVESSQKSGTNYVQDGVSIYGMCGLVMVNYINILSGSPASYVSYGQGPRPYVITPYAMGKLTSVTVSLTPTQPTSNRNGTWSMVVLPLRNSSDEETIKREYSPMEMQRVQQLAGSVSSSSRPVNIKYTPKPSDGIAFNYNPLKTNFLAILIAYQQSERTEYCDFPASDLAVDVTVSAKLRLRRHHLGSNTVGYKDKMYSPVYPAVVYVEKDKTLLRYRSLKFDCSPSLKIPGSCRMIGPADRF